MLCWATTGFQLCEAFQWRCCCSNSAESAGKTAHVCLVQPMPQQREALHAQRQGRCRTLLQLPQSRRGMQVRTSTDPRTTDHHGLLVHQTKEQERQETPRLPLPLRLTITHQRPAHGRLPLALYTHPNAVLRTRTEVQSTRSVRAPRQAVPQTSLLI